MLDLRVWGTDELRLKRMHVYELREVTRPIRLKMGWKVGDGQIVCWLNGKWGFYFWLVLVQRKS